MPKFKDRTGEKAINMQGYEMTIVNYKNSKDIDVQFNDELNTIYQHKKLTDFYKGKIKNPNYLMGLKSKATNGQSIKIIGGNAMNLQVEFEDGTIVDGIRMENFYSGKVRNINYPYSYGFGYIGLGEYKTIKEDGKTTLEYRTWSGVLERCYSEKFKLDNPTYIDCVCSQYFHNFQNFAEWYQENLWSENCTVIDKDILHKNSKLYSEDTCVLVDQRLNNLFTKSNKARGISPIGTSFSKAKNKYSSTMSMLDKNGIKKHRHLGYFNTSLEAFQAYKQAKELYIKQIANEYKDKYPSFPNKLYQAMLNYEVSITD